MTFLEFYNFVLKANYQTEEDIPFSLNKLSFRKGDIITQYGQTESQVYFINEGIVEMNIRSYVQEKVVDFFFENEMFCALTSFIIQIPSDVQITALTDCQMEMVHREELMKAYEHSLEANKFGRIITEHGYIRKSNREKDFLSKTAEERYFEMFNSHAQYLSQIPVNKIARYLGIHPESLSRIRNKLNS
jgi:CRP-like cAMP-binding protein